MSKDTNNRWWEFYGIRYGMGTVVGAIVVFYLVHEDELLKSILLLPGDNKDLGMAHVTVIAALGLAYCYISSAPILVLHACRNEIQVYLTGFRCWSYVKIIASVLVYSLFAWLIMGFNGGLGKAGWPSLFLLSGIGGPVCYLVFRQILSVSKISRYYFQLTRKREKHKNVKYVESYRHLREHGNSFFIVFFEITLGVILYYLPERSNDVKHIKDMIFILLLWVFPAIVVWFIAISLERVLVEDKRELK